MEKIQHPNLEKLQVLTQRRHLHLEAKKPVVWDCGSSLYDSFELNSFNRQLDSALASRSLSMSHLPDHRAPLPLPPPPPPKKSSSSSKISRSVQKLLKSVFKSKQSSSAMLRIRQRSRDEYSVYYDKTGALTTIPEVPEIDFGGLSPEINSLAKRTPSERFTATSNIVISCA
ncbi:uncharacterized protein LOC123210905 [Mangifera indica]|uniref:uncharacterized protein LOC123210905 n=1 Tax=Mangifera indica TaxID=29780 RepID=UPI001CFA07F4|nr:uncharacterized protein LOC123210905 [Mangifera indica]